MNRIFKYAILLFSIGTLTSCADNYKYFGNSYEPTQYAKIYFKESDIDQPYEEMGKLYASFKTNVKDTKVQNKIMNEIKKHGGDAAVFGEMYTRSQGSVTTSGGASTRVGKKKNTSVGVGTSKTKNIDEDQIEIIVIKYKKPATSE